MVRWLLIIAVCVPLVGVASVAIPPEPPKIQEQLGVMIPMRDHVRLAADIFMPSGRGHWPAILIRTPYNRKGAGAVGYRSFAQHGYAVVIQDVRGRYASQGTFGGIAQEGADGNDTINWISEQPWSTGRVAMAGASYLGIAQWWAAIQDNPHLVAIAPVFSGDDEYTDRFYSRGGAMRIGHRLLWLSENLTPPSRTRPMFGAFIDHVPLRTADHAATGILLPMWQQCLNHPSFDDYWKSLSIREQIDRVNVPVLSIGGWFDDYAESDLDAFSRLTKRKAMVETWIAPTGHNPSIPFKTRDFGPEAKLSVRSLQLAWFDWWFKRSTPAERADPPTPKLHIFVMGPNVWREEHEWPLARTRYSPLYLSSSGHANSVDGDGLLSWHAVPKEPLDQFTYDPKNPVPTIGGAICCNAKVMPPGPLDQSPVEGRNDVLVYTSAPLTEDVEVTGPVRVVLYVSTSANDSDFTAKLVDVQPDGQPLLVTDGIQRLRYRLSLTTPVFVKRNTTYQIGVDAGVTSYVFEPGHRIRLEVSSSDFPHFDRNFNTTKPIADETRMVKARQTIYHRPGYLSAIILPVIPHTSLLGHNHEGVHSASLRKHPPLMAPFSIPK
ncbi:MAG TPA: CocE/NonD family hydrolase [Bryobacteraceae bacterium]|nr:CocE/NonD family hydrolase [Bryobacteraceae bacterium]